MFFFRASSWQFAGVLCVSLGAACGSLGGSSTAQPEVDAGTVPGGSPSNGRAALLDVTPRSLDLSPGDSASVRLRVSPPGVYEVQAALLGESVGAFLDAATTSTDESGEVSLNLTVATESSPFSIRLSAGGLSTEVPVAPRDRILADVTAIPRYDGKRPVTTWYVTVSDDPDCSSEASYAQDSSRAFPQAEPIRLQNVDAARPRTILIRGEDYIFGCKADVLLDPTQPNLLDIPVSDKPLQLGTISTPLTLGLEAASEVQAQLNLQIERMVSSFNAQAPDSVALLEQMALASLNPAELRSRSSRENWRARLETQLGAEGATNGLSRILRGWLFDGSQRLFAEDTLTGRLISSASTNAKATYELMGVAGVAPRMAGVPAHNLATLGSDSEDRLRIGVELYFQPSRLLSSVAEAEALGRSAAQGAANTDAGAQQQPINSAPGLLADTLGCETFGESLAQASPDPNPCEGACLAALCSTALENMWQHAASSSLFAARLELSADAEAQINSAAKILSFAGGWVGNIQLTPAAKPLPVRGTFTTDTATDLAE